MSALVLNAIFKKFGAVSAVDNISLCVPTGNRLAIVGPSGSGKSTLLRLIAGFEFPDAGRIELNGLALVDDAVEVPAHKRQIGYVPQDGALFPHLSVASNIGFGLDADTASKRHRVQELMEMVALDARMYGRMPHELSGGQQQRVALARALAQQPKLMLLDEPFSALDTGLRASMRKTVTRLLSDADITTILVTHDQAEALSFADQLAIMRQGKLVQHGVPEHLYQHPVDEETALFLGDAVVVSARISQGWATSVLGRIAVRHHPLTEDARIMLRPEQLTVFTEPQPGGDLPSGRVLEADYSGGSTLLTIELSAPVSGQTSPLPTTVSIRSSQRVMPQVGSRVSIGVQGIAHVLRSTATERKQVMPIQ